MHYFPRSLRCAVTVRQTFLWHRVVQQSLHVSLADSSTYLQLLSQTSFSATPASTSSPWPSHRALYNFVSKIPASATRPEFSVSQTAGALESPAGLLKYRLLSPRSCKCAFLTSSWFTNAAGQAFTLGEHLLSFFSLMSEEMD